MKAAISMHKLCSSSFNKNYKTAAIASMRSQMLKSLPMTLSMKLKARGAQFSEVMNSLTDFKTKKVINKSEFHPLTNLEDNKNLNDKYKCEKQ